MISAKLLLLAVPLGIAAFASLHKHTPATGPSFQVKGKSGTPWRVVSVSTFTKGGVTTTIHDVFAGGALDRRVLRYSQTGSDPKTRSYITSPFDAGTAPGSMNATLLRLASLDFGVPLPPALAKKIAAAGGLPKAA